MSSVTEVSDTDILIKYLFDTYKNLKEIIQSFQQCSKTNNRYLVDSKIQAINFDKLTQWIYGKNYPMSADSMTFSDDYVCLIEFKSGSQKDHKHKLIKDVSKKINNSENLIFTKLYPNSFSDGRYCNIRFFLVIEDDKIDSVSSLTESFIKLSTPETQKKYGHLVPDLKENILNPEHFEEVDVWYSSLFDKYLQKYNIKCIEKK